jgi:hypothetical protein
VSIASVWVKVKNPLAQMDSNEPEATGDTHNQSSNEKGNQFKARMNYSGKGDSTRKVLEMLFTKYV